MSMSRLVAALGAVAGGVSKGMDEAEAAAERKRKRLQDEEDRAYTMQERAFTKSERDRALKQREDLGAAAAPIAAEAVPQLDMGDPEAAPPTTRYRVAGKMLDTSAEADAAVKTANGAPAVAMRQAAVLQQSGDPVKAQALRTGSMQEQAGQLSLSAAERADLKAKFTAQLDPIADFEQLGEFMSKSGADGQGGGRKMKFVPSPDGKTITLNDINPDGTLTPTARTVENSNKGLTVAKAMLGGLSPEKILEHFHREEMERRAAAAQQEAARHNQAMEGLTGDKTAAQIEIASMRAAASAAARAAKAGTGQPEAPLWDDKADAFLRERYTVKDPNTGAVGVDGQGMQFGKMIALGQAQANGGDTTRALGFAFEKDTLLREAATDAKGAYDHKKHEQLRAQYLTALMQGGAATAPKKAEGPAGTVAPAKTAPTMPKVATEKAPAPAGSPQAAWDAKQAKARTDMTDAAAAKSSAEAGLSAQFQADKAALSPIDLARKYDKTRAKLSAKDAAELQAVERSIR